MHRDGLLFRRGSGSRGKFWSGLAALMIALSLFTVPARAQQAAAPAATPETVNADDLQRLVNSLENEQDRARLVQQLRALIAAERNSGPTQEPPQSQPTGFFGRLPAELDAISGEILATAAAIVDAPRLIGWVESQVRDAEARARWIEVLWHLAVVLGLGALAELATRAILSRPRAALASRSSARGAVRVILTLLR